MAEEDDYTRSPVQFSVTCADNGFIVRGPHPNVDGEYLGVVEFTPEEEDDPAGQAPEAIAKLFWLMLEMWLAGGTKHSAKRVQVRVVKQGEADD
jgi:hypothetical protein